MIPATSFPLARRRRQEVGQPALGDEDVSAELDLGGVLRVPERSVCVPRAFRRIPWAIRRRSGVFWRGFLAVARGGPALVWAASQRLLSVNYGASRLDVVDDVDGAQTVTAAMPSDVGPRTADGADGDDGESGRRR
jgi:hypothetical protein